MDTDTASRFWGRVDKAVYGPGHCWIWMAYKTKSGYGMIRVHGAMEFAHRLAYESFFGSIPDEMELDHICHNPACVNPYHLRPCLHAQNTKNRSLSRNNSSGYKGVSWSKKASAWQCKIKSDGIIYWLGYFKDPKEGHDAYIEACDRLHGLFANHG